VGDVEYVAGDEMKVIAKAGARPDQIARSVYDDELHLLMKGLVGITDVATPTRRKTRRALKIDLLQAPAKLIDQLIEMGLFENHDLLLQNKIYLSKQLGHIPLRHTVTAARTVKEEDPETREEKSVTKVLEVIHDNEGVLLELTPDQKEVKIHKTEVLDGITYYEKNKRKLPPRRSKKRALLANKYMVRIWRLV